ncbi:helix-hairpin-helix domain-containing protein [Candidatus Nomurabacteria bacterium]|nr:helix-hairpin-helix domain-containing protein [Candidatus Nomurabacteria bacterium]
MKPTVKALATLALLAFALPALAAVNINTAGLDELDALPGIGSVKAQAIIDYRTANGPFETKEELLQVDGIGQVTYDGLKDLITIDGENSAHTTTAEDDTDTAEETETPSTSSGSSSNKGAPLKGVKINYDTVVAQAPTTFTSVVTDTKGTELTYGVRYWWNFGDGTTGTDAFPVHTYQHPGTYTVTLRVTHKDLDVSTEATVDVLTSGITLSTPGDGSVALKNTTNAAIDIGGWMLVDQDIIFTIPSGTRIAKGAEVRFARSVTGLFGTTFTRLLFPNGILAASVVEPQKDVRVVSGAAPSHVHQEMVPQESVPSVDTSQSAAVAHTPLSPSVLPWAGLVGVVALGSLGTYFYTRRPVTKANPEEFDIV